jgi:Rab-3A-interacting protein
VQWSRSIAEVKEQTIAKLQEELHRAHEELKLKDEEVGRLSRIRQDVEAELEELTASLFQVKISPFLIQFKIRIF